MSNERKLFFSLWAILLIGFGLWRFRVTATSGELREPAPAVTLSRELFPWFEKIEVVDHVPSRYTLELHLRPPFRETLKSGGRDVQLGYRYLKDSNPLLRGELRLNLQDTPVIRISLPNGERLAATGIELFLAR